MPDAFNAREEAASVVGGIRALVGRKGLRTLPGKKPVGRLKTAPPDPAQDREPRKSISQSCPPEEALGGLRGEIGDCQRCPLGASRIKLVFGVGNPGARVMFVGEGPGYAEDRQGEPFVGPAGQLLDKILAATGLSRRPLEPSWKWVYIANMVKCHPMIDPSDNTKRANDRPPTPEEMAVCSPFLLRQISIIRPLFIVALGATAGKALLRTEEPISRFRGQWSDFSVPGENFSARFLPTYHPAALLRNSALKPAVWEDMKSLKAALEAAMTGGK